MEALAALRLNLSPRRYRPCSSKFYEDESAPSSPYYVSAPTSPRGSSLREVEETPLGEVHAAVPFEWELKPGTPKRGRGNERDEGDLIDGVEERSRSPSPERLSHQSSTSDFDFSSARFIAEEDTAHALSNDVPIASADQLFFHGQLLPLRLPPRLQAVKHIGESPCSDGTTIRGSFRKPVSPRSGNKLMSFRGRSKSPHREARDAAAVWPVDEVELGPKSGKLQRFRSLSPLRIFRRENSEVSILFSDKSIAGSDSASSSASSSSSSAFSSSSSGDENSNVGMLKEFWPSFEEKQLRNGRSTLNDFLYSDKPFASPKIDISKLSSKELLSKAERFKASEEREGLKSVPSKKELEAAKLYEKTPERKGLTPQLSRSNARSISRYVLSMFLTMSSVNFSAPLKIQLELQF